jgi:hypothetical protein
MRFFSIDSTVIPGPERLHRPGVRCQTGQPDRILKRVFSKVGARDGTGFQGWTPLT